MEGKRVDTKLLLFTLVLVLITLLLLNYFLKGNNKDEIWNYEEITTAAELIYLGEEINDREIYYTLESIVQQYLNSYVNTYSEDVENDKITYVDYYDNLVQDYKEYLSKSEYEELAKKFLNKFYVNAESEYETMNYMDTERIIKSVYDFGNNVYLCELKGSFTKKEGYIAIGLNTAENIFNIIYIE